MMKLLTRSPNHNQRSNINQGVALGSGDISLSKHRTDIQGLRAIAVGLVVLDHVFRFPVGGFVGVDVFFVISGFLITSLMLRELEETGSISFRRFYARRVRRIMPVATVALCVTVIISALLWFPLRAIDVAIDAFWAFLFMANWHFQVAGSDYFASGFGRSPIMHYWSLSIEEQFYALWPLILLAVALLTRHSRRSIIGLIVAGVIASCAWAAWVTGADPSGAYFDSLARAWELLLGALIAAIGVAGARTPPIIRKSAQWLGLMLIAGNALLVSPDWSLPFPWVAPAVVGAALVIWANASGTAYSILDSRLAQWLGDISYSLYVWHFPIIIFAMELLGAHWWVKIGAVVLMIGVATLSHRWIEQPFMNGPLLARAARVRNAQPWVWRDVSVAAIVLIALAGLMVVQVHGPAALHRASSLVQHFATPFTVHPMPSSDQERANQVYAALAAKSWPASMNEVGAWRLALGKNGSCVNPVMSLHPRWCGDPNSAKWYLMGDSVAMSWVPAVFAVGAKRGHAVAAMGYSGCQLSDGLEFSHPIFGASFPRECAAAQMRMYEQIRAAPPPSIDTYRTSCCP